MAATTVQRTLVQALSQMLEQEVLIRGWVYRLRVLAQSTFIILRDCSGEAQCVAASEALKELHLKLDDTVEIHGRVRADSRAQSGYEVDVIRAGVLNRAATSLPFNASSNLGSVGPEVLLEYRPLAVRNDTVGHVFRVQAALLKYFREYLSDNRFTEIITSKIVASGTEGAHMCSRCGILTGSLTSPRARSSTRNKAWLGLRECTRPGMCTGGRATRQMAHSSTLWLSNCSVQPIFREA